MLDVGILNDGEPVELISGYVMRKWDDDLTMNGNGTIPRSILRKFTVTEYHKMIEAGILTTDDRVELLEGYVVNKMPQNTPHSSTIGRLQDDFLGRVPAIWKVRVQLPITCYASEPEPDLAIVRGDRRTLDFRNPIGADFGIVIEVVDSSLAKDRNDKGRMYAQVGIPVYWIVNLLDGLVELYTDPQSSAVPSRYGTQNDYFPGQDIPIVLDGQTVATIPVSDLLP